jgi:hypothetical protein
LIEHNPPPNFAKEADTRFAGYVREFGTRECWELDALAPTVIADLIRTEIEALIERRSWDRALDNENRSRAVLNRASRDWAKVEKVLARQPRAAVKQNRR